jgi:hypothetical protein
MAASLRNTMATRVVLMSLALALLSSSLVLPAAGTLLPGGGGARCAAVAAVMRHSAKALRDTQ